MTLIYNIKPNSNNKQKIKDVKIEIRNIIRLESLKSNIRKHRQRNNRIIVATGTMHQNTKCRGTNRDTEVDLCDTGTGTIRMATRGRP